VSRSVSRRRSPMAAKWRSPPRWRPPITLLPRAPSRWPAARARRSRSLRRWQTGLPTVPHTRRRETRRPQRSASGRLRTTAYQPPFNAAPEGRAPIVETSRSAICHGLSVRGLPSFAAGARRGVRPRGVADRLESRPATFDPEVASSKNEAVTAARHHAFHERAPAGRLRRLLRSYSDGSLG
jgi:hypothetical protein